MWFRISACLWIVVCSCGCSVEHFRAETELFPDGSVDRSIWQPLDEQQRKRWPEVHDGISDERLQSEPWDVFDIHHPKQKDGKPNHPKNNGWSARGRFGSVEEIPEHYRVEAPPGLPASTLKRQTEREDFVFVTEHRWEETLTDCVKLDEIPFARRELIDFVVPILVETLRQELTDYDVSAVEPWLRDEGATWLDELISLWIDLSLRHEQPWVRNKGRKSQGEQRLKALNARQGLKDTTDETLERFGQDKAKQLIRKKDGTPITDEFAAELVRELLKPDSKKSPNRFHQRGKKLITEKYSSDEIFQKQVQARLVPIIGLHSPLQLLPQDFDYRLTMPGDVFESNGEIVSANRVRWRFNGHEAYPFGYSMRCRSLQPNDANQRVVFKNVPIKTSNDCQRLVRLLRSKSEWRDVLLKCVEEKSQQPLLDLRTKILRRNDFPERLKFDDLAELLHIEAK